VDRPDGDRGYSLRPQGAGDGNGELTKLTMLTRLLRRRRESRIEGDEAGAAVQADQLILADEAIKVPAQDSLGRGPLVERICAAITAWPNGQPLVVAITGSWGEGKTSVVNLVLQEFRRTGDHVIVEFDPWFFNSAEALIQGGC
jgi:hypothetical protein